MKENKYEGLPRVTEIVATVCGDIEEGWLNMCKPLDPDNHKAPTEEEILDWSSEFGSIVHGVCLEDKEIPADYPDAKLVARAVKYYNEYLDEYLPARIKVEVEVIHPKNLYGGTVDKFCRILGDQFIVDLKTFGWWKEKFGYMESKDPFPSAKKTKVNLQTTLYDETQQRKSRRSCLVLHPSGWIFHEFKRDSSKLEEALKVAETKAIKCEKYLLTDF